MNLKEAIANNKLAEFIQEVKVKITNENQERDFWKLLRLASKPPKDPASEDRT